MYRFELDCLKHKHIPLIKVEQAAQGLGYLRNLNCSDVCLGITVESWHRGLFALEIENTELCPRFHLGYRVILDTTRTPVIGNYVLVHFIEEEQAILGKLIEVKNTLKLLVNIAKNELLDLSQLRTEQFTFLGIVINTIMTSKTEDLSYEAIDALLAPPMVQVS